jgi:hypothetical protein
MKLKVIFIILIIIFLSQLNVEAAGVYLGSFTPDEDQSINISVPIQNIKAEIIKVYVQNNYFTSASKKINSENLKIIGRNNLFPLSNRSFEVEKNNLFFNRAINFQFDLKNEYEPGLYENILYIDNGNKIDEYEIVFEIQPWKKMVKADQSTAVINNLNNRTHELYSSGQQKLIIISNTDWKLKIVLSNDYKDGISIKVAADSESRKAANFDRDFKSLNSKEIVIASGSSTTFLDSEQVEIFYQFKIDDFKKIQAGEKNYQFNFILE